MSFGIFEGSKLRSSGQEKLELDLAEAYSLLRSLDGLCPLGRVK